MRTGAAAAALHSPSMPAQPAGRKRELLTISHKHLAVLFIGPLLIATALSYYGWDVRFIMKQALSSHGEQNTCSREGAPFAAAQVRVDESRITVPASILAGQEPGSCHLHGTVDACCNCTYQSVDTINHNFVHAILYDLVKTAFFRYFKVNVYCDCPLWPDDSMCSMQACSVCECDNAEVPQPWLVEETQSCNRTCDTTQCAAELDSRVDAQVDPSILPKLLNLKGWRGFNNPWMAVPEEEDEEYLYINLLVNPERYTGYQGEHAHRIWSSIYNQSCFDRMDCEEKRVFYRLISGMHASISAHISAKYLLDEDKGLWGRNLTDFEKRLGTPSVRDRVENLYFAYLFVLRAVMKAGPLLERFAYVTGLPEEDTRTARLIKELVNHPYVRDACPMPFDEGRLWKGHDALRLRDQLQQSFQNITRIMDCVGCEKCKLWGKLQTLGIATALKVLFSSSGCDGGPPRDNEPFAELQLERNEVISLINLLERFSSSIEYYKLLSTRLQAQQGLQPAVHTADPVV